MAPDLNAVSNEKWEYSKPGSAGYNIPNITYDDPKNRPLKVLTIGAGFSGILMAYQIQKYCKNVEHVICMLFVQLQHSTQVTPRQMKRTQTLAVHG
jgi:NADH dehydrogenase FAD-containing subunit